MTKRLIYIGEIRDPIHGLIPLTEIEFKIIDTSPFQRLRGIKQLAMAHLGFPGANHTRFEHSIGVMHVASKIIQHLENERLIKLNKEAEQNIRLAGLLHDIGHGPFSHVSENLLEFYAGENNDAKNIHEEISRRIITENKEIVEILGGVDRAKEIATILETDRIDLDYKHDIVSGPLDGDKMDYLLRDSYYSGVKYGIFDLERLVNVLTTINEGKKKRLAVKFEGLETVEQYVLAKYFITQQVYEHKTRLITDIMIVEGIKNAIENGNKKLEKLYSYNKSEEFIEHYLYFNDHKTIDEILSGNDVENLGFRYFKMLKNRKLLKELFRYKFKDLVSEESVEARKKMINITNGESEELKGKISESIKLYSEFTHIKAYSIKDPLIQKDTTSEDESILIKKDINKTKKLDQESSLYKNIIKDSDNYKILVFGLPKISLNKKKKNNVTNNIKEILIQHFGG